MQTGIAAHRFDDTIDGYFPLHLSLKQMLERRDFAAAIVTLDYAPFMHFNGLADDAPVPLNIKTGFAGIMERVTFCVAFKSLSGIGTWRWLDEEQGNGPRLMPRTRLAEPCYLTGLGFKHGLVETEVMGRLSGTSTGGISIFDGPPPDRQTGKAVWGPFTPCQIVFADNTNASHGDKAAAKGLSSAGFYIVL